MFDIIPLVDEKTTEDGTDPKHRSIETKEALWVAAMACIGILFLLLLNKSGHIMSAFLESGASTIPISFWIIAVVIFCLCSSIFYLLKDSESMEFKISAFVLTGIAPAVATLMVLINILKL